MRNKTNRFILLGVNIVIFIVFYSTLKFSTGLSSFTLFEVVKPIAIGSISLVVSSIFALFMKQGVFKKWLYFSTAFVALSVLVVSYMADSYMSDLSLVPRDGLAWVLGIVYVFVSVGVVIYQTLKNRKKS
jgi:hypothetical protein